MAIMSMKLDKNDCLALATRNGAPIVVLSPLGKLPPSQAPLSESGKAVASNADAMKAVDTLARPGWLVTMRMGAGDWPITELCLCGQGSAPEIAGIRPTSDGMVEVLRWASACEFADWWCDAHANATEEPTQNFIPPPCTIDAFVMVLQAIDAHRRAFVGSLLTHQPADQLLLTAEEFNTHCLSGIRAHDVRWLTPAFVSLVPGFGEYKISGNPHSARAPFDRGFLKTAYHPDTGEPCVGFGEPGQAMGLEFARSWLLAAGLEARLAAPEGTRAIARCFIAPTGVTNHLASFETDATGVTGVNHQTVTIAHLKQDLTEFIERAAKQSNSPPLPLQAPPPPPSSQTPPPPPPSQTPPPPPSSQTPPPPPPTAAPVTKFCSQCGTKMEQAAAFCPACGAQQ